MQPEEMFDAATYPIGSSRTGWLQVDQRADGGLWRLPLMVVTGQNPGPTLVVTAAVHGDEYEGVAAIPRVYQRVSPADLRGRLLMAPICNVAAYAAATRSSPVDGLNLARVFPGESAGTLTQRIADRITTVLLQNADFYIDLHSGGVAYDIPTLVGYIHDDGALGEASLAAALAFDAPILWGHPLPLPPGRTISTATNLGIPSLYTEAPGGGYAREEDVDCFADGVLNVMRHLGMLAEGTQARRSPLRLCGDGNLDAVIVAGQSGYFRADIPLLAEVDQDQPLGVVSNPFGEVVEIVRANRAGIVIMLRRLHRVQPGEGLVGITNIL